MASGSLALAWSVAPSLGAMAFRGWDREEEELAVEEAVVRGEGEEGRVVNVRAVRVLCDVIRRSSSTSLSLHCRVWRSTVVRALQECRSVECLKAVAWLAAVLVSRAHTLPVAVPDFPSLLPPLLSVLVGYQHSPPALQEAVLPAVSMTLLCFPGPCKLYHAALQSWAGDGLLSSFPALSRESSRLLLLLNRSSSSLLHGLLSSSISRMASCLHLLYKPASKIPVVINTMISDLPSTEPHRSAHLLLLISVDTRFLCHSLSLYSTLPVPLPLCSLVGVILLGLSLQADQASGPGLEAALLLSVLPSLHSLMWTLLTSLLSSSSSSSLFPFSSLLDCCFLRSMDAAIQLSAECVQVLHVALCQWVVLRGEGGDTFTAALVRWLVARCQEEGEASTALQSLCVVVTHCGSFLDTHTAMLICQTTTTAFLPSSLPANSLHARLLLLLSCVSSPLPLLCPPISLAVRLFKVYSQHTSAKVCAVCVRGLSTCSQLLHPAGPPWMTAHQPWWAAIRMENGCTEIKCTLGKKGKEGMDWEMTSEEVRGEEVRGQEGSEVKTGGREEDGGDQSELFVHNMESVMAANTIHIGEEGKEEEVVEDQSDFKVVEEDQSDFKVVEEDQSDFKVVEEDQSDFEVVEEDQSDVDAILETFCSSPLLDGSH